MVLIFEFKAGLRSKYLIIVRSKPNLLSRDDPCYIDKLTRKAGRKGGGWAREGKYEPRETALARDFRGSCLE